MAQYVSTMVKELLKVRFSPDGAVCLSSFCHCDAEREMKKQSLIETDCFEICYTIFRNDKKASSDSSTESEKKPKHMLLSLWFRSD